LSAARSLIGLAPFAPTVTATKTDSLFTDVDNDTNADPGDTLKYAVTINSSGGDATGVTFTDTVDPNTAFVGGSLTATPVAVDDSYTAAGNIRISVAAPGVLGNDFTGVPAATITAPPTTSTNGGDVSLAADGSFTYNPPPGFEGVDTFTYTLANATGSNNATVTITVSGMIWFIDNNAAACTTLAAGCGRLTNPFSSLSAFASLNNGSGNNPAANDNIFLYESASDYIGPVTLLNGQRFIGQDAAASLSAITGVTPPAGSDPLPATNSGNGTIVNITNGNAITVGSGDTLRGFTGGDSTTDISGTGFGTLTISDVTLNGIGQALNLTTGTLAATFGSISSTNSGTTGISLTSVAGSLTSPTTTVTNPTGIGISVGTSNAALSFGNTTSTLSGGTGVSLLTNTGTITFGALSISPDASQRGLLATDNTNTITSTGGAITTSGAIAVEITRSSGTTPLIISETSVSASSATSGIVLTNTSGSFTVSGNSSGFCGGQTSGTPPTISQAPNPADCTGGTIQNSTGAGILLNNATNVSLTRMQVLNGGDDGIFGTTVTGFTLASSLIDNNGNAVSEAGLDFDNLFGTSSITNSTIRLSHENNVEVRNTTNNGSQATLTVTGCQISNASAKTQSDDGVLFQMTGTSNGSINVSNSVFTANRGDHLQGTSSNSASLNAVFTNNNLIGGHSTALGQGIVVNSTVVTGSPTITYDINGNKINGAILSAITVNLGVPSSATSAMSGQVRNNIIGTTGVIRSCSEQANGIAVDSHGKGTHTVSVTGNTMRQCKDRGINVTANNSPSISNGEAQPGGNLFLTVQSNAVLEGGPINPPGFPADGTGSREAFLLTAGSTSTDTIFTCLELGGAGSLANNFNRGTEAIATGLEDIRLRKNTGSNLQIRLPGYAGGPNDAAAVAAFEVPRQTSSEDGTVTVAVNAAGAGGFIGGAACALPPAPSMMADTTMSTEAALSPGASEGAPGETQDILLATQGEGTGGDSLQKLSQAEVLAMVQTAIERWRAAGISAQDLMRLQAMTFEIADLPEGQLATATSTHVKIDETAAGYGWYFDSTPMDDEEFEVPVPGKELQTTELSPAFERMDLLTVVMRELGIAYRQGKSSLPQQLQPLMQNGLSPAVRRLPDSRNIQLPRSPAKQVSNRSGSQKSLVSQISKGSAWQPKTGVSKSPVSFRNTGVNPIAKTAARQNSRLMNHAPRNRTTAASLSSMLADVMLNIGTLPAGESVTITFNVTVDDPFTGALPQVSNQGTVSGTNFADVLTDDPTVGGTADPTVTPIDLPQVTLAVSPASVLEDGATNLVYTFTRTGSTANTMTVNFSVGGTASFTEPDYTQTGAATFTATSGTVVFASGSSTATVTIDPSADTTVEPDETVNLTVTSGIGYTVGSPSAASGTITNDDTDVSVAVSPASVTEDGAANLVYTFTRVGVTTNALTVNFSIAVGGNNAVFPLDYTQSGAATFAPPVGTVTFGAGNSTATVTVDPAADPIVEPDETVIFTVTSGAGYNVGSPGSATGTITNDDADVTVTVAPSSVTEDGPTNLVYTFTRTGFTLLPVTVNFSVGGTAVFSQPDYTQTGAATYSDTSGTVIFGAGASTATVTIDPAADTTVEPDETVILTVTSGTGYNVGSPDSATGTITNDDTDVSVAVSPGSVGEDGATNLVYTFTRAGVTSSPLTVNFSVGGTAVFSQPDYTQTGATIYSDTSGTVVFGAGASTATVTIDPSADTTVEPDETVILTVTSGAGYNVGLPSSATGTITNDDTDVSVAVSPASVAEDGGTNLVYTFMRNGVTSGPLTVNFSVGGTANFGASPNDYTQTGATTFNATSGSVTFAAGSFMAAVTVNPETDTAIETDETVILTLTSGAGYNVSSPSSATGTITNDDADVSVAVSPASVTEDGATNLVYTFTRTGFTGGALTVNFSVGGTATFGSFPDDYTQTGATTFTTTSGSVTFAPGSPTATVTVDPETDTTAESDETVVITLTAGASYNAVSPNSATGTILNDDTLVSVAVAPSSTSEGGANLVYTFTRTGPTGSALTVNFSVGGTASFPADYSQSGAGTFAPPTATVTFGAGSSTATVTVTPLTDCTVEGSETVEFTVQPGSGYGVGSPSTATGTITNTPDSGAPTITLIPNVNMTLSPPNHTYRTVAVTDFVASASDDCDPTVNINSVYILKITSDEAENGNGDGNTLNDIVIAGDCKTAQLRAERSVSGNGRVYTITFKVKDSAGNFTTATGQVTVRSSANNPAVNDGPIYTVNSSCP